MKSFLSLSAGILSLGLLAACSATQQSQAVAATEAVYTVDANLAAQYKNGELGIKPDATIVADMQKASALAKTRIDSLRTAAENGETVDTLKVLLANDAVNTLTVFLQDHGLIKDSSVKLLPVSK